MPSILLEDLAQDANPHHKLKEAAPQTLPSPKFENGASPNGTSCQGRTDLGGPEPVAIIGMAFNFPQGAVSDESFWDMLVSKRNASTDFPKDRMNIEAFHDADPKKLNTVNITLVLKRHRSNYVTDPNTQSALH